jgi:transposase
VEILRHWHAGRRIGQVCSSLAVDPKTVRKYTTKATEAGLVPGGPPLSEESWSALVAGWFSEIIDRSLRQVTWPEIEAHRERIKGWLGVVTVSTIHQRLRDDHGLGASESSLRRFILANFDEEVARDAVRVLRDTPPAGEEAQVDYGLLGRWFDPATERMRQVWGFMIVLTCSRLMFLRPVLRMDQGSWVESHALALEFFGGSPRRIVPDNLKTGVIKADLHDPLINKAFGEFAAHYGCLVDPARRLKPRDKATVERHVPYARDSFFAGRSGEFASLAAMQEDAVRWARQVANQRQCRPFCGWLPRSSSTPRRPTLCCGCPARPSSWPAGARPRSAPTSTSRWARPCTRCPGRTSAAPWTPGRACAPSRSTSRAPSSRPTCASRRAARPITPTTRRRRSPS